MKNKIIVFLTIMCLCMTMFCGVSMADEVSFPNVMPIVNEYISDYPYAVLYKVKSGGADTYNLNLINVRPFYDQSRGSVITTTATEYREYKLIDGEWSLRGVDTATLGSAFSNVIWTNKDILNSADNTVYFAHDPNFFLTPLSEIVEELTEMELKAKAVPAMTETMGLLTACGVGLMALLMALVLLRNKFSHFLP